MQAPGERRSRVWEERFGETKYVPLGEQAWQSALKGAELNPADVEITHMNLNDDTLEGFRHRRHPVFCVQYHPEAAPGPHDSHYLFDDFVKLMEDQKSGGE